MRSTSQLSQPQAHDGGATVKLTSKAFAFLGLSGLRNRDVLYSLDGLNRVTLADQGNLSGGTITGRTRKEAWPVLDLTGNWIEPTLDHNGDGSITGLADRDEQTNKGNAFSTANEWLDSDQKKAAATGYDKFVPTYTYDASGHQTAEEIAKVLTAGAGTTYERRFFTYDPFGRMTAVHSDLVLTPKTGPAKARVFWDDAGLCSGGPR